MSELPQNPPPAYAADTLGMPVDEMRALGYAVVDSVIDRLTARQQEAAMTTGTPAELLCLLGGDIPEQPGNAREVLQILISVGLHHMQHGDHPRYFARVPGPSSFAALLGEWVSSGFNTNVASWAGGSGPATLELVVLDWLRTLMGFPQGTEGVLVSGGSMANLTAMAAAREFHGPGIVYLSDQTHASVRRGLLAMGISRNDIRIVASDDDYRMSVRELSFAVLEDRSANRSPMMVVASAGTTNTGAVDPLHEIADLCEASGMWMHVDGAYGAPGALCESGQRLLSGMERADSLVVDPHKWLYQPYDIGCVLIRHPGLLQDTFTMNPEYLQDIKGEDAEVNFHDRSLELTRRSRAAKLWMTFRTYGVARIRKAINDCMNLAEYAELVIRSDPEQWTLLTPAQLGIVTFTLTNASDDDVHARRARRLAESGFATVSSTTLKGQQALRLCIINPLTTRSDIDATLQHLAAE